MRHARRELHDAGLIAGGLRLSDRGPVAERFRRIRHCLLEDDFADDRERELAVLLAWSGVLAARLSKQEQRVARRRLKELVYAVPLNEERKDLLLRITADVERGDGGGLASAADFTGREPSAPPGGQYF